MSVSVQVYYVNKARMYVYTSISDYVRTFGISAIRTVLTGQFSGWNEYSGGAEKGLQTRTLSRYDVPCRSDIFAFTCTFS